MCNACGTAITDYRVVAVFLHQTAAVRAYCGACYPAAAEGDYRADGDGLLLDYRGFTDRFGAPGPPPPPATPVDRLLAAMIHDPDLRRLSPPSEAIARRRRQVPYPVLAQFTTAGGVAEARMTLGADGRLLTLLGDPGACDRVRELAARV
ncbi:MAG TPA: hypothetical protein VJY35_04615 [Candidatus Eisenbacteria bacterium]|nr:hypothetical protein [Candidatus Eisenbacteria bacterium]